MKKTNWVTYPQRRNCCSFVKQYSFSKSVKDLKISITSMGWYHLYIDDKRIDKDVFSPGWTNYKKRIQYQSYPLPVKDKFTLRVDLAEGWGGGDRFAWAAQRYFPYFPLAVNYELVVIYQDDTQESFYSDTSLEVYENKYIDSTIYYGEQVDFRRKSKFIGNALKIKIPTKIIPQEGPHIVYGERIPAQKLFKDKAGNMVVDFGQNFAGVVEINIKGKKGDVISYTPGEILDKNDVFYNDNYRKCKDAVYSFVLSGKQETLIPSFSFLGGRYIKLIEYPKNITKENFIAILVHSDMKQTCFFETGNKKINRLYLNTKYGQLSNYLDVPTDCPQRDERLGWTADAQIFSKTAAIHYNVHTFFKKWIHDLIDSQFDDGSINAVVPLINDGRIISTGWGDAATIIPYEVYQAYGDKKLLKEAIPMMEKWINYLSNHYEKDKPFIVNLGSGFGDWLALDKEEDLVNHNYKGLTDFSLIDTAFYAYSVSLLIKCLEYLRRDSEKYVDLLEKIKKAYQKEFIHNHHMRGEKVKLFSSLKQEQTCYSQTGLVLTLYFDLCSKEDKPLLADDLDELIKECGNKLTTGFLGTPYLLYALSNNNKVDTAYNLLFQEEYPSWLYSVNMGATTMWEHYDGIKKDGSICDPNMNSFNHYAYGSIFSWIFESTAGIRLVKPQYKEIIIQPLIDKRFGYVKCSFDTKYGTILSNWEIVNNEINFDIKVPKNIKAKIILPNKKPLLVNSGCHIKEKVLLR